MDRASDSSPDVASPGPEYFRRDCGKLEIEAEGV